MIPTQFDTSASFKAVIETTIDSVVVTDIRGMILYVNQSTIELFGYSIQELLGKQISLLMPESYSGSHKNYMDSYLQTGEAKVIGVGRKIEAKKKNGELFPCWLSLSDFEVEGQTYFTGVIKDYSALEKAHKELADLNKTLEEKVRLKTQELEIALSKSEQLSDLKSRFLTLASHEFKTPLSTILSSTILIEKHGQKDNSLSEAQQKHTRRIKRSVHLLNEILEEFINIERIEQNQIDVNVTEFTVKDLVEDLKSLLSVHQRGGQELICSYQVDSDLIVQSDYHFCLHVLMNLLSNAIKFSVKNTPVHLTVIKNDSNLEFHVIDQGIGIPKADQHHIFDRFYRADNANSVQGTGIGLHIAKQYSQLLGGDLSFVSKEMQGSHFIFSIPKT